jgi:demethylmenaquinone methyltransferase / 2-methoxy-6-polyprenyl-1,4-benzoquinol methylase
MFARKSGDAYKYLPASVGEFPQGEALLERMCAAGLNGLRRYPLTIGVVTLYVGTKGPSAVGSQPSAREEGLHAAEGLPSGRKPIAES